MERQLDLITVPEGICLEPETPRLRDPVWTRNKARLIERYLFYFVLITKHGTYIDGFAGPQEETKPDMWAAKLVLHMKPKWLRHFHLFERSQKKIGMLQDLKTLHGNDREVEIYEGDFNLRVRELLNSGSIRESEATFCLLDQHTFECHWATVEALARHKSNGKKIEIFYFLANSWIERALAVQKNVAVLHHWWGNESYTILRALNAQSRSLVLCDRFKTELGYRSAKAYPIWERERGSGGRLMYFMIHATDHPLAPFQMVRAYNDATQGSIGEQGTFQFEELLEPKLS